MIQKQELLEQAAQTGLKYEQIYRGCAQCTIAAVQDTLGLKNDALFKAASGLAGGCGGTCEGVCGGLSGGIMIMSSCFGRSRAGFGTEDDEKLCSSRMAKVLYQKFVDTYGSGICKEIHGEIFGRTFDFWNAEDRQAFDDAGGHTEKCPSVVANASRWTVELILEELEQRGIDLKDFKL
jgi:C_GCAxxG_C_C family probable redox protein